MADRPGTRFELGSEGRLVDVPGDRVPYGVCEQAAFEAGKLDAGDVLAVRANVITVQNALLCLSPEDQGWLHRAYEVFGDALAAWDGSGAAVRNHEAEAVAAVVGSSPESPDFFLHRGLDGQTVIRVPDGVDQAGLPRDLEIALDRVPAVVAVELLSIEAA